MIIQSIFFGPTVYVEPVIYDDETDETTTTTTTTTVTTTVDEPAQTATVTFTVVGDLPRGIENGQFYVIDPADQTKTFLNPEDDLYEDANGEVWNVIDTAQA
jgi:3'-phosphoadenosine 5'-phosphosulfate (PAPS) 3'-phosphatase